MKAKSIMVLGTASGVGKSLMAAALCRILSDAGYNVAPFKAQNMSNNSWVTEAGGEMGRAQVVQAECARVTPHVDMNPVLLKPAADNSSQVIVHGKAVGHFSAKKYYAEKNLLAGAIRASYERLAAAYEILVIEGAGSPAEVNLKDHDLVNMKVAEMANAACLLVGDIDRGGVFAQLIGTLDLLEPHERERITGLVVNKFRGDRSLFEDGVRFLEERTGKKVCGVIPFDRNLWIEEEDGMSVEEVSSPNGLVGDPLGPRLTHSGATKSIDIAVLLLPRISNFTDFDLLKLEPGVRLRYIRKPSEFGFPDLLILPGTKATIADLRYLKERGYGEILQDYIHKNGRALGICGGYQMLGEWIRDPNGIEAGKKEVRGFGFFKMATEFHPEKVLRQVDEPLDLSLFGQQISGRVRGYEIHMGRTFHEASYAAFGKQGAIHPSGQIAGTYYHGLFQDASFRSSFLHALAKASGKKWTAGKSQSIEQIKESHYQRLGGLVRSHLDWEDSLVFPLPLG